MCYLRNRGPVLVMLAYIRRNETPFIYPRILRSLVAMEAREHRPRAAIFQFFTSHNPRLSFNVDQHIIFIMRRHRSSHLTPSLPSPKRRRTDNRPAGSSQSSKTGLIDLRLIEGSQHNNYSSSYTREISSLERSTSTGLAEDPQLDDFGGFCLLCRDFAC